MQGQLVHPWARTPFEKYSRVSDAQRIWKPDSPKVARMHRFKTWGVRDSGCRVGQNNRKLPPAMMPKSPHRFAAQELLEEFQRRNPTCELRRTNNETEVLHGNYWGMILENPREND